VGVHEEKCRGAGRNGLKEENAVTKGPLLNLSGPVQSNVGLLI